MLLNKSCIQANVGLDQKFELLTYHTSDLDLSRSESVKVYFALTFILLYWHQFAMFLGREQHSMLDEFNKCQSP